MMDLLKTGIAILILSISVRAPAQSRPPIIDVHLHAQETPLNYPICAGVGVAEVIQLDGTPTCKRRCAHLERGQLNAERL